MKIFEPAYFSSFRCLAGNCPDSCCKEWSVEVDEASAAYYRTLPGALGDRLRQVLSDEDGATYMTVEDGRCPMWRQDGLCRIQAELGEGALCRTCREFPRLTHDYGDFAERGLELSCPEAARIILSAPAQPMLCRDVPGGEEPQYDPRDMESLQASRERVLELIANETLSIPQMLACVLLYTCQAQSELDGEEEAPFDIPAALALMREQQEPWDSGDMLRFFSSLEILTRDWPLRLAEPEPGTWHDGFRNLMAYFVQRYWLQAVSDFDLYARGKAAVVSCVLIYTLGGDFLRTAQLYSKEIENSAENVDALLDAAYTCPAVTDSKLLHFLGNA